jgi:hypothetical protein
MTFDLRDTEARDSRRRTGARNQSSAARILSRISTRYAGAGGLRWFIPVAATVVLVMMAGAIQTPGWQLASNLTLKADLTLRESFDSNVYLQDVRPDPTVTNAVQPFQESFVTSITPRLALDYAPCSSFRAVLSYAPEVAFYHSEPSEDHVSHRGGLHLSGSVWDVSWEQPNSFTWIDGSRTGPTFGGPGGMTAVGGIPIRDRRAAFVYRGGFKAAFTAENWLVRPVSSAYVHDFLTHQSTARGYENYVDRTDVNGGLDVGYRALPNTHLIVGYRYGRQYEGELITTPHRYDNTYHRVLFGIEGRPAEWLKLNVLLGPDFRSFFRQTAPGFDDRQTLLFIDSAITILPTANDTLTLAVRRFAHPAFGSCSIYEDITYEAIWRHTFGAKLAASAGFRAYAGDWLPPATREDWIFTPSAGVSYAFDEHLSADVGWFYDWAESHDDTIPDGRGREYTRHVVSLSFRYAF